MPTSMPYINPLFFRNDCSPFYPLKSNLNLFCNLYHKWLEFIYVYNTYEIYQDKK
jgi:hypothetical protein